MLARGWVWIDVALPRSVTCRPTPARARIRRHRPCPGAARKEPALALFNPFKKRTEETTPQPAGGGAGDKGSGGKAVATGGEGPHDFDSNKAAKFFERAQTLHEATNFGYAMNMWIRGLRFDPIAMNGLEGFFKSAGSFFTENPKGEKEDVFKSTVKDASGRTDVDKYLTSLVQWSSHPFEPSYSIKAMELASSLGLGGPAVWIAERAVGAVARDKKPRKDHMVAAMKVFHKFDKFDLAVQTGEAAIRIDPLDGNLASEVKNLSAEWTTKRGGFDQTGEAGGFRSNMRDAAKQRQMEERDRVVTTDEVLDRVLAAARADNESVPNDRPNAIKFIDSLIRRGKPEDEEEAFALAEHWHEKTKEFRFRETADGIRVRQLRRRAAKLKAEAEKNDTPENKHTLNAAVREFLVAEIQSLEGAVAAYPTDLGRKFELAKRYYKTKKFEEAIGLLQIAKDDAKNKAQVFHYLGLSFGSIGMNDEAIETLRQAQGMQHAGDEGTEMELKYGLMEALLARAKEQASLSDAEEASSIASQIVIKNMSYKEVRARRDEAKALIVKLKSGGGVAG